MKKLLLILFLPIILNAQSLLLFGGDEYGFTISLGDSNSTFSDTTSTGDWFATANDSVYNGGDSTLIGSHIDGYIGLPLASTAGQKYRATMQMKEGEDNIAISGDMSDSVGWSTLSSGIKIENGVMTVTANGSNQYWFDNTTENGIVGKKLLVVYDIISNSLIGGGGLNFGGFTGFSMVKSPNNKEIIPTVGNNQSIELDINNANNLMSFYIPSGYASGTLVLDNIRLYILDDSTQSVYAQPTISYGTKSQTKTALSNSWQNYTFDFVGNTATDTLKISLSDTAKVKIDNVKLRSK